MLQALLYLNLRSAENLVRSKLGRLRQPKYLLGALASCAYFYFFFIRGFAGSPKAQSEALHSVGIGDPSLAPSLGALMLLAFISFAWLLPKEKPGLAFTEAEVSFLFSAPLGRKTLIRYKIAASQSKVLLTSLILTLVTSRSAPVGGNGFTHAIGWWLILSFIELNSIVAALAIAQMAEGGISTRSRRMAIMGGLITVLAVVIASAVWPVNELTFRQKVILVAAFGVVFSGVAVVFSAKTAEPRRVSIAAALAFGLCVLGVFAAPGRVAEVAGLGPFTAVRQFSNEMDAGLLHWLLWPLRLVIAPYAAIDGWRFVLALVPALAVVLGMAWWAQSLEASFEDASIAGAEKRAARIAAFREGRGRFGAKSRGRTDPFRLGETGAPEIAFFWKNRLSAPAYLNGRVFAGCAVGLFALLTFLIEQSAHPRGSAETTLLISGIAAAYIVLLGPQYARQDLRTDMHNLDLLKAYPLPGWRIVAGQMLTPIVILSCIGWLGLIAAYTGARAIPPGQLLGSSTALTAVTVAAALAVPVLAAVQILIANAFAVVFPAWQASAATRGNGGFEVLGQRLILSLGRTLMLLLILIPPAVMTGLSVYGAAVIGPVAATLLAAIYGIGLLVGEFTLGLWWVGRRFEALDFTTEIRG